MGLSRVFRGTRMRAFAAAPLGLALLGAAPAPGPGGQWPNYNNQLSGIRYSALKEITPANVARLGEVCKLQIDGPTAYNAGLIVVDGTIYTATSRETVAVDATNCKLRWRHSYVPDEEENAASTRGTAVADGRVFRGTGDGRLIALDAATGKLLWKNVIGNPKLGEFAASAPLVWQGVVFSGISGGDRGIRGRMMAFDAATGKELWRFYTIPMGKDVGAETWKRPESAKTGGGGMWGAYSLDPAAGEIFIPVGNPWPDLDPAYRPGNNLFTNSVVVLDAATGKLKWWFQSNPADPHDLDLAAAPVLYRHGTTDYLAFAGKDGFLQVLDRDTHKLKFKVPITTIENRGAALTKAGVRVCPAFAGGVEWNGPALDPVNRLLITGSVDHCFTLSSGPPTEYDPPIATYGGSLKPDENGTGWVTAVDSRSGEVKWRYHAEKPVIAGVTPTAGGVTFTGDLAGNLLMFDTKTGALVRKVATGGSMAGGVVTYELGGRQYVAFATGNVSRNAFGALGLPSVMIMALDAKPGAPLASAVSTAPAGAPDARAGGALYGQVCINCHGADGDTLADHRLSTLASRRDFASTAAVIKDPPPGMPKMFPGVLSEQNVVDVAAYLQQGLR